MQSEAGKAKILSAIKNHLKPGGKFLSHEMLVRSNEPEVRKTLSQTIRVNANTLTISEWSTACQDAGLTLQQQQTGTMGLLNLNQILRDEGFWGTVTIAWNILTNSHLRPRVLQMRRNFQKYRNDIGYIVFLANVL